MTLYGENMPLPTVVIAQNDPSIVRELTHELNLHFALVAVAESVLALRTFLMLHAVRLVVLDLELATLNEVHQLVRTFNDLNIVCTHRTPDERMWMAALKAGAVEFCHPMDISAILCASSKATKHHVPTAA
jgi:DNA-binding NtrC family response regulator